MSQTSTFHALRERNARLFFAGLLVSNIGTWVQLTALALTVKKLAVQNPGQALGNIVLLQFLPMLVLGAWAGGFADRRNRLRVTKITQTLMTLQAIVLTVLDFTNHVGLPAAYLLSFTLGMAAVFDNPARRGLVLELVDEEHISNAMSLNTAVMTGSRIFGPALAAIMVRSTGTQWCYLANALSFGAVLFALFTIDRSKLRVLPAAPKGGSPVRDGLRFVWRDPTLRLVFTVMVIVSTFAQNYQVSAPLLADHHFGDVGYLGLLLAAASVGSLAGSLLMASRGVMTLRMYLGGVTLLGVSGLALSFASNLILALLVSVPMGIGGAIMIVGANSITQSLAPPMMRSRLLALTAVAFLGSTPIGGPITGWIGDHLGAEWSQGYGSIIALLCVAYGFWALRRLDRHVPTEEPVNANLATTEAV